MQPLHPWNESNARPSPSLQFECYEYLFEAAVRMHQMGLDAGRPPAPPAVAANGHATGEHCCGTRSGAASQLLAGGALPQSSPCAAGALVA